MRAVLIGINQYPGSPLNGCVNDIVIMRSILMQKYGVPSKDIRVLTDSRATKQGIISRIKWLMSEPFVHEKLLLYFSGHGSYLPNKGYDLDDEYDGNDELICPVDMDWNGTYIKDDEIYALIKDKPDRTRLTMVFDSCHSGTMFRASASPVPAVSKFLEPPIDLRCRIPDVIDMEPIWAGTPNFSPCNPEYYTNPITSARFRSPQRLQMNNTICITGCEDHQTSADAYFYNRYQGALSYCLQRFLYMEPTNTVDQLRDKTTTYVKELGFSQNPQFHIGPNTDTSRVF